MKRKQPPIDRILEDGRRLWQRMVTLQCDGRFDEASAEIYLITDVRVIMAALNVATAASAFIIKQGIPDEAEREKYLTRVMLGLEQQG